MMRNTWNVICAGIVLAIIMALTALFDSAGVFFQVAPNAPPPSSQSVSPQSTTPPVANKTPAVVAAKPVVSAPSTQNVAPPNPIVAPLPRDQHWKAQTLLIEASVAHSEAVRVMDRWNEEVEPLRNNANGNVVAANDDLLQKLAFVFSRKRADSTELDVMGRKIESLTKLLEAAASKAKPEALPVSAMMDIGKIHNQANSARQAWDDSLTDARAVVLKARLDARDLRAKLDASQQERSTLQQELEKLKAEQVVANLGTEMETGVRPNATVTANPAAAPQTRQPVTPQPVDPKLRAKALSLEVKAALATFLEARTLQPSGDHRRIHFVQDFDKKPMSYSRIVNCGALDESVNGLRALARIGSGGSLDRLSQPTWPRSLRGGAWTEDQTAMLRNTQKMLIEYGQILVDEGLLSP